MSPTPAVTVINAKAVIDGTGANPLENAAVVIEGSTIKALVRQGQVSLPEGPHVRTLDFPSGYLLPGLIDSHIHLSFGVYGSSHEELMKNDSDQVMLLRAARNAFTHLKSGVTTVRENGARNQVAFDLREGARRGYATTPRLYLCGRPVGQATLPEGPHVRTLDFPNGYLLPGLIDSHIHLSFGVYGSSHEELMNNDSDQVMLLRAAQNAFIHLKSGVTTVRENGARNQVAFDLREGARRGYATTPRLYLCGRPVTITGGHFHWCNQEADGVDGVRVAVRELIKDGADHIKIMASGGATTITDNRKPSYSVEELRAIVDEAHNFGKLTTAHCLATQSLTNALDAGLDMIEHAGFREPDGSYKFDNAIAERIAERGLYVCPTVQTGFRQREALMAKELERPLTVQEQGRLDGLKAKCESQLEFLGRMWNDFNINIVSGTDAVEILGDYCLGLELMAQAGMSNMDIIKASTSVASMAMDAGHLIGTVEPGKEADLIVVDQDPLQDIRSLRSMRMVMRAGQQIV